MTETKKLKVFVWDLDTEFSAATWIGVQQGIVCNKNTEEGQSGRTTWRRGHLGDSCRIRRRKGRCAGAQWLPLCRAEASLPASWQNSEASRGKCHPWRLNTLISCQPWDCRSRALDAKAPDLCWKRFQNFHLVPFYV